LVNAANNLVDGFIHATAQIALHVRIDPLLVEQNARKLSIVHERGMVARRRERNYSRWLG